MGERAKVVIIGGGIAGCSALYHLAKMGCTDVLLLERDELTSGSTWHAAGNVPTYSTSYSVMQVQKYSAALYRELAKDKDFPISYHVTGSVRLAHSEERMAEKPECISPQMARQCARAARSAGSKPAFGLTSFRYSPMASVSHT